LYVSNKNTTADLRMEKVIENVPLPEAKKDMRGPLDLIKFKIKEI